MKARRNPIGLPLDLPPGLPLVRVGDGVHTHILNMKTRKHLCESGKNAGKTGGSGAKPLIFTSDAQSATCYRCIKLAELNLSEGREAWDAGGRRNREARNNPQVGIWIGPRRASFTPSYGHQYEIDEDGQRIRVKVTSQQQYDQVVADCDADPRTYGCKRRMDEEPDQRLHHMLMGGRAAVRYGGERPKDPISKGPHAIQRGRPAKGMRIGEQLGTAPPGEPLSSAAQDRLEKQLPYWNARTQSPVLRALDNARRSDERINEAIQRYMAERPDEIGFRVPDTVVPLLRAGMPPKIAYILVSRAAGRTYLPGEGVGEIPIDFVARLQEALGAPITLEVIGEAPQKSPWRSQVSDMRNLIGSALRYQRKLDIDYTTKSGEAKIIVVTPVRLVEAAAEEGKRVPAMVVTTEQGTQATILLERIKKIRYNVPASESDQVFKLVAAKPKDRKTLVAFEGNTYVSMEPYEAWLKEQRDRMGDMTEQDFNDIKPALVAQVLENVKAALGDAERVRVIYDSPSGMGEATLTLTEHSKLLQSPSRRKAPRYKRLTNLNLEDLPRLMASVATRKKHKGRRLPPMD